MSRPLQVQAEPLPENSILGLRENFAKADVGEVKVEWDHNLGYGGTTISMTVKLADGERVEETLNLSEAMTKWALQVLAEQGVDKP